MRFILVLLAVFTMIGCSHDDSIIEDSVLKDNINQEEIDSKEDTRYYVKYEVYMPLGGFSSQETYRKITFVSEEGQQIVRTSKSTWEGTFGPLKKNTKLYLKVEAESGGIRTNIEYYVRLSVSRDKEPFVIKGEQRNKEVSSLETSYTIDF